MYLFWRNRARMTTAPAAFIIPFISKDFRLGFHGQLLVPKKVKVHNVGMKCFATLFSFSVRMKKTVKIEVFKCSKLVGVERKRL